MVVRSAIPSCTLKIPMMLARYAGLRGQTIVAVLWKQYRDHDLTGKCFRFVARKTKRYCRAAVISDSGIAPSRTIDHSFPLMRTIVEAMIAPVSPESRINGRRSPSCFTI